jgi:O-antigen ligase
LFTTASAAVLAIVSAIAFFTVNWSGPSRRVVIAILMGSVVMFLAGISSTMLTAARDTYARGPRG